MTKSEYKALEQLFLSYTWGVIQRDCFIWLDSKYKGPK